MKIEKNKFKEEIDSWLENEIYSEDINMDKLFHEIFVDFHPLNGIKFQDVIKSLDAIVEYLDSKSKNGNIKEVAEREIPNCPELKKIIAKAKVVD